MNQQTKDTLSLKECNDLLKKGLTRQLGICLEVVNDKEIIASMPVDDKTKTPGGILHGGANLALAETLAGVGSLYLIDIKKYDVRGIQVSANHLGCVKDGHLKAVAKVIHTGKTTHIWNIDIFDKNKRIISTARVTNMIVNRK